MTEYIEYTREPWLIRAVFCLNIQTIGLISREAVDTNVYIWFVGNSNDEWFAHGLSEDSGPSLADRVSESINGAEMDVMLAYGGLSWEAIMGEREHIAAVAQAQRDLAMKMPDGHMNDLMALTYKEIKLLRLAEERDFNSRLN